MYDLRSKQIGNKAPPLIMLCQIEFPIDHGIQYSFNVLMQTIYILDDHKLFSGGLELLLKSLSGELSCRSFDTADDFLHVISTEEAKITLFVIDFYIPGCNVPDLIQQLLREEPSRRVLVVSASINLTDRQLAMDAGASLFLNKNTDPELLLKHVSTLLSGATPDAVMPDANDIAKRFGLTPRQLEILVLVSKGLSNKEVARTLEISPETVKTHLGDIFRRFEVSNKIEAVDFARSNGLA